MRCDMAMLVTRDVFVKTWPVDAVKVAGDEYSKEFWPGEQCLPPFADVLLSRVVVGDSWASDLCRTVLLSYQT